MDRSEFDPSIIAEAGDLKIPADLQYQKKQAPEMKDFGETHPEYFFDPSKPAGDVGNMQTQIRKLKIDFENKLYNGTEYKLEIPERLKDLEKKKKALKIEVEKALKKQGITDRDYIALIEQEMNTRLEKRKQFQSGFSKLNKEERSEKTGRQWEKYTSAIFELNCEYEDLAILRDLIEGE